MEMFISFLRINTFLFVCQESVFHYIISTWKCPESCISVEAGGFVCALSELVGLVSVSLVLMRQRSEVPFSFSLNDDQGVYRSLPQLS